MAYPNYISKHPDFASFDKLSDGLYLNCMVESELGEMQDEPIKTAKLAKAITTIYEITKALPVMESHLSGSDDGFSLKVTFIGYAVFEDAVLVTVGGTLSESY